MSFLTPLGLLGLLAIPVILLLHFLRNRRKEMPISSLRLWRDLEQHKQGAQPRGIPLTLLLILQLLAAGAIALALARPASSFLLDQPERFIFILDTSTSMAATDQTPTRFEAARQQVKERLQALDENDSFAVISLDANPKILMAGGAEQKLAALSALDDINPGAAGTDLARALTLTSGLVDAEQVNRIIILTDGNYDIDSQTLPAVLAPIEWQWLPPQPADTGNQALFNVSARRMPDGRHRIFARVVNYSDAPVNRTLRLSLDEVVSSEDAIEIQPQSNIAKAWTVSEQAETTVLEIIEPDILPDDNRAELLLLDTVQHQVLLISRTPDLLAKALQVQPGVELTVIPPTGVDYNPEDFDLIIFDDVPGDLTTWPPGNVLVVNPPPNHPLLPGQGTAQNVRPEPDTASSLFDGIDLSGVFFNRIPRIAEPDWAGVDLRSMNSEAEPSTPLVFQGNVGDSRVMVWAFDLAASNLPSRLALPLLTANTLSAMLAPSPPSSMPVGQPVELVGNFNVETPDGHRLYLASGDVAANTLFSNTSRPGIYKIYNKNNILVAGFAAHAGSPIESNLQQRFDVNAVTSLDAAALTAPEAEVDYNEFWPWLAGLALLIIMVEGWLAWRK